MKATPNTKYIASLLAIAQLSMSGVPTGLSIAWAGPISAGQTQQDSTGVGRSAQDQTDSASNMDGQLDTMNALTDLANQNQNSLVTESNTDISAGSASVSNRINASSNESSEGQLSGQETNGIVSGPGFDADEEIVSGPGFDADTDIVSDSGTHDDVEVGVEGAGINVGELSATLNDPPNAIVPALEELFNNNDPHDAPFGVSVAGLQRRESHDQSGRLTQVQYVNGSGQPIWTANYGYRPSFNQTLGTLAYISVVSGNGFAGSMKNKETYFRGDGSIEKSHLYDSQNQSTPLASRVYNSDGTFESYISQRAGDGSRVYWIFNAGYVAVEKVFFDSNNNRRVSLTYGANSRLDRVRRYDPSGFTLIDTSEYEYAADGSSTAITFVTQNTPNGEVRVTTKEEDRNPQGQITEQRLFTGGRISEIRHFFVHNNYLPSRLNSRETFTYYDNGESLATTFSYVTGRPTRSQTTRRDSSSRITERVIYTASQNIFSNATTIYEPNGSYRTELRHRENRIVNVKHFNSQGGLETVDVYYYTESGHYIVSSFLADGQTLVQRETFDSLNRSVTLESHANGVLSGTRTRSYHGDTNQVERQTDAHADGRVEEHRRFSEQGVPLNIERYTYHDDDRVIENFNPDMDSVLEYINVVDGSEVLRNRAFYDGQRRVVRFEAYGSNGTGVTLTTYHGNTRVRSTASSTRVGIGAGRYDSVETYDTLGQIIQTFVTTFERASGLPDVATTTDSLNRVIRTQTFRTQSRILEYLINTVISTYYGNSSTRATITILDSRGREISHEERDTADHFTSRVVTSYLSDGTSQVEYYSGPTTLTRRDFKNANGQVVRTQDYNVGVLTRTVHFDPATGNITSILYADSTSETYDYTNPEFAVIVSFLNRNRYLTKKDFRNGLGQTVRLTLFDGRRIPKVTSDTLFTYHNNGNKRSQTEINLASSAHPAPNNVKKVTFFAQDGIFVTKVVSDPARNLVNGQQVFKKVEEFFDVPASATLTRDSQVAKLLYEYHDDGRIKSFKSFVKIGTNASFTLTVKNSETYEYFSGADRNQVKKKTVVNRVPPVVTTIIEFNRDGSVKSIRTT